MPFGFWVLGLGCRVKGLWFRKGLRVEGARFRIQGSGFKEWNKTQNEEYVYERKFSSYLTRKLQMLDLQRASRQFK